MRYVNVVLKSRPVLYWPMGDRTGTSLLDRANLGNDGVYAGSPTLGVPGPFGPAVDLAPASGHNVNRDEPIVAVQIPTGTSDGTMEAWIRPDAANGTILAYGTHNIQNTHRVFQADSVGFTDGVNAGNNISWTSVPTIGVWTHVALVIASAGTIVRFYKNAVLDKEATVAINTTALTYGGGAGTNGRVRSGVRSDDGRATNYFDGRIAHAAIYARALSTAELFVHFLAGRDALGLSRGRLTRR